MNKETLAGNAFVYGILLLGLILIPSCGNIDTNQTGCIGWEFNTAGNSEGWQTSPNTIIDIQNGNLTGKFAESGSYLMGPTGMDIDASVYKILEMRYRVASHETNDIAYLYWTNIDDNQFGNDKRIKFEVITNNIWQESNIDFDSNVNWNGKITGIQLYPAWFSASDTLVEYDYIRLCPG